MTMAWREAAAPLRERNFRWFYAARFASLTGSMMVSVALAFAVLEISDSASALGLVLAANTTPMVVFLLFGGVLSDRFDRARLMRFSAMASFLSQATVATLVITDAAELWMVIALEVVNGAVSAVSFPAMSGVVPQLVPRAQLQSANVLLSMSRGALAVVGPTLAGVLVVTVGPGWALAVDATMWLLVVAFLSRVRIPARPRERDEAQESMLTELREGWSIFTGTTWLWVVVVAFAVLNAIHAGAWFTLGPVLAKDTIGERGWGMVLSAESVGLLVVTAVLLRVRLRRPLRAGMLGCATFGVPLFLLGADPQLVVLVAATFVAGMGMEIFGLGWNLAMQENIDESVLSRAYSYDALGSFVAMPVGQIIYGPLGEAFGYRTVLMVSGVVYTAVALLVLLSGPVRRLGRAPAATVQATSG
ncbi:MAG TPA: MFS transporter [Nocardioidaceae bacterium]|nr:MFS transporter [Nocardioidaceae bacterium]